MLVEGFGALEFVEGGWEYDVAGENDPDEDGGEDVVEYGHFGLLEEHGHVAGLNGRGVLVEGWSGGFEGGFLGGLSWWEVTC